MALKTFKYRLYPTPAQERQMFQVLNVCRHWYNMCLAERKYTYALEGRSVSKSEQERTAIQYRKTFSQAQIVFSQTMQTVCADLDKAFQAFFRRVKAGEKPGYPRFKGRHHFHSFAFKQFGAGARLDGRRLKLYGIGRVPVRWHRPLEGQVKTVRIIYKAGCWYAAFACEIAAPQPLARTGRVVGVDVGISALATLSDGVKIENPNYYRAAQKKLRALQRQLARCQHGSKNRRKMLLRVQRQQEHVAHQRKDYLEKLCSELIAYCDRIALEKLRIINIVRNRHLSKSILDSGWGFFAERLRVKAESAGRDIRFVDPSHTSKCCSKCGAVFADFDLSTRWVECECGLSLDRDHNAALNILKRTGWDTPLPDNVAPISLSSSQRQAQASVRSPRL
jgi:putative transposase